MKNRKIKPQKIKRITRVEEISLEERKVISNRFYRFKELVGDSLSEDELKMLVHSKVDYWDLQKLLENNCPPDLAIKILL